MFKVGDIVRVGKACMDNPPGSYAICYEVYQLGGEPGCSLIFQNGRYDGFSKSDLILFDVHLRGHCERIEDYLFKNVLKLEEDFRSGLFEPGFKLVKIFKLEDVAEVDW